MLSTQSSYEWNTHEPGGRQDARRVEHRAERHARPLADRGPAFLARVAGDLRARRELLQLGERERSRRGDAALDRQAPVGEAAALQPAVGVAEPDLSADAGIGGAGGGKRRDVR